MPRPAPTADRDARDPTAPATFSGGNSSLMMPNAAGIMPPATPWMTRATIMIPMFGARAASTDPTASATSVTTKTRSLPIMSPTRPRIGVKIDADSR